MNKAKHVITEILSQPLYYENGYYVVKVAYDSYGHKGVEYRLCWTEEEAKALKVGDVY